MRTRIDPQSDAVVFAGSVQVSGFSSGNSNRPSLAGDSAPAALLKQQHPLSMTQPTQRSHFADTAGGLQAEPSGLSDDVEERFRWQAQENQQRLMGQVRACCCCCCCYRCRLSITMASECRRGCHFGSCHSSFLSPQKGDGDSLLFRRSGP